MSSAIPVTAVVPKPAIAAHDALPRRDACTYRPRWSNRTTAYVQANSVPSLPNAWGTDSPATKMNTVATSSVGRTTGESAGLAFTTHTKADHAHHISASTSIARPKPAQLCSRESSVVTWVTANTNTRSQNSSTGLVRRSSWLLTQEVWRRRAGPRGSPALARNRRNSERAAPKTTPGGREAPDCGRDRRVGRDARSARDVP